MTHTSKREYVQRMSIEIYMFEIWLGGWLVAHRLKLMAQHLAFLPAADKRSMTNTRGEVCSKTGGPGLVESGITTRYKESIAGTRPLGVVMQSICAPFFAAFAARKVN